MKISQAKSVKSTHKISQEEYVLDRDLSMHIISTNGDDTSEFFSELDSGVIQLTFCSEGQLIYHFGPHYKMDLVSNQVMTLYNPSMRLPHRIEVTGRAELVTLFISVDGLHKLFIKESEELHFLKGDKALQKFYAKDEMKSSLSLCINQLFTADLALQSRNLYMRGKAYELLSYYFNKPEGADLYENCPFLKDHTNVKKIRKAKTVLLDEMTEPPTIKKLSELVEMSEYQLKLGFKNIYGNTIYGYLNDYKMNMAKKWLDSGQYKVQDAAFELGYTNPSHFIAAFKKKFGITPKKYLMQ